MNRRPQSIAEWQDVDADRLRADVIPRYQPAVMRGLVRDWPAVRLGLRSPEAICDYLLRIDNGQPVDAILSPVEAGGRIGYNAQLDGFNFLRRKLPISALIEQVARYSSFPAAPRVAVQSALIADCLPQFAVDHRLSLLDASVLPRIWLGGAITTPAHFDLTDNIACVVAGRRRFTLFPPEQVGNLYIGPLEFAPTRMPISLVDFGQPDFQRFPRFADALAAAQVVELEPGDALYIPPLWWHHVESLAVFNVLVNYWWTQSAAAAAPTATPFDCLLHCLRNMNRLSPPQRTAWAALFQHYLFAGSVDPAAHIPLGKRGVLERAENTEGRS